MVRKILLNQKSAYIVGLALGDGNLSNPNGRAVRLRITSDLKYPYLISKIQKSIQEILPNNKVSLVYKRNDNSLDISCYSNTWEELLGWYSGKGSKLTQNICIPQWIINNKKYFISCLRGLIETDGSIYTDRGYKTVMFTSANQLLSSQVNELISSLGFKPHVYTISGKNINQNIIYRVRLATNVQEFLDLVKPEKR